jgi:RNA polymerase sigma factor (sigma-70 family)
MKSLTCDIATLRPTLMRLSKRFTQNREESSDLVQDTLLRALTHKEKFRENTNLQGWLFTIMRNTFINDYRKNQHVQVMRDHTPQLYRLNVPDPHTFSSPERKCEWHDLWKNINALKGEFVIPFKLHTSGYKYHEIAEQLNLPIGTVKNRIFHARKEIQKRLV